MRTIAAITLALWIHPPAAAAQDRGIPLGSDVEAAVLSITPEDVMRRVGILADDSMRGRQTPSPELDQVAAWIGSEFASFGLRGGGDNGSFVQRYPLVRSRLDRATSGIRFSDGTALSFGEAAAPLLGQTGPEGVTGPGVVVGGRAGRPEALATLPLEGKIVFWVPAPGTNINEAFGTLQGKNPAALVLVRDRPQQQWDRMLGTLDRVSVRTGWSSESGAPIVEMRTRPAGDIFGRMGVSMSRVENGALNVYDLRGPVTVRMAHQTLDEMTAPNVVGILEGSDPQLRHEYLVFSAHMDHVGVGRPVDGDSIYNGADDDASGTAGIMEVAQAFSQLQNPPRRSIIFLTVSGEEHGLWGSDFFALHPGVEAGNIVANLNADMIGRNWPDTIVVIGKEHSDLGETMNQVNARHPELNMTAIDDIWPEENFYFRSDHFNFARRGVPVLFFFNGTHGDYHQPSDEVESINAEKESRIVRLLFYLGYEIANRRERPQWNPESYRQIVEGNNRQ